MELTKTFDEKINYIEENSKAEIKCGANGDAFCFNMDITNVYKDDCGSDHTNQIIREYESDELSEWLQKIADLLGIKYPDEFNLKLIETKIKEIGEKN